MLYFYSILIGFAFGAAILAIAWFIRRDVIEMRASQTQSKVQLKRMLEVCANPNVDNADETKRELTSLVSQVNLAREQIKG